MTTTQQTPDTSVIFSLAELADIEEERVREEAAHRAAQRQEQRRARLSAQQAEREAEVARVATDAKRRAQLEQTKAEERARNTARERAAADVERIAAQAQAQLTADNAMRDHELSVLRVNSDSGRARLRHALAAVIGILVIGSSVAAWAVNGHISGIEAQSQRLRDDRWALSEAHDEAMKSELASLDLRHEALRGRAVATTTEQARVGAEAARSAIEAGGIDSAKLRALSDSLDELSLMVNRTDTVAAHDRRLADLTTWAKVQRTGASKRRTALLDAANKAGARAHGSSAGDEAVASYDRSLDALAALLAGTESTTPLSSASVKPLSDKHHTGPVCDKDDPMCGLDGKPLIR